MAEDMKPEVKAQWVAALRSGEYKQATGCLRSGNNFCCLGVLADLYSKETGIPWGGDETMDGQGGHLPRAVCEWAGISSFDPTTTTDRQPWKLSLLNDREIAFGEIADLIEKGSVQ